MKTDIVTTEVIDKIAVVTVDRIDQNNEWKGAAQNDRADN